MESNFKKPIAKVIGKDSNIFVTLGICTKALYDAGYSDKSEELTDKVMSAGSYNEALNIMREYCVFK